VHLVSTRVRTLSSCQVIIVRRSLNDPISQARSWASSDLSASAQALLEHISARWDIDILFADGKEERGLDQSQLMRATALVRFWSLALRADAFLDEARDRGNALSPMVTRVGRSNVFIDARFFSGFASSSRWEPLTNLCVNSSRLHERSFGKVQRESRILRLSLWIVMVRAFP